jgi:hypothetical protein
MMTDTPSHLSDAQLIAELQRLARSEREITVALITHLAELDSRRLYLGAGFSSLFGYCTEVLRLSEHEAYNRIEVARVARKFPLVLEKLAGGSVNLTTLRLLAPHLTADNHVELMAAASGRSKREVEEILAGYFPRPALPSSIRRLPVAMSMPASGSLSVPLPAAATVVAANLTAAAEPPSSGEPSAPAVPVPATQRPSVSALAPDRFALQFIVGVSTRDKLRLAQDLLRHAIPDGDLGQIVDRALTALLDDLARKKLAAAKRPAASRGTPPLSRHIPARVKRAVWLRDSARCAFVGHAGRRCRERGFLEFHHVTPYAVGGPATVENIQLRCRAHNAYEADLYYGPRRSGGEEVLREVHVRYSSRGEPRNSVRNELRPGPSRVGPDGDERARSVATTM